MPSLFLTRRRTGASAFPPALPQSARAQTSRRHLAGLRATWLTRGGGARTSSNAGRRLGVACQQRLMRSAMSWSTRLSWSFGRSFEVTLCGTSVCEMPAACLRDDIGRFQRNALEMVVAESDCANSQTAEMSGGQAKSQREIPWRKRPRRNQRQQPERAQRRNGWNGHQGSCREVSSSSTMAKA